MTNSSSKSFLILPVGLQSLYFVLIALGCYMGLDAFGVSFSNLVAYNVTTERLLLSYGGVILCALLIFFKSEQRFYRYNNVLIIVLVILGFSAVILSQFNEYVYLFRGDFKTDTPFFIGLHAFMAFSIYGWIILFTMAYYTSVKSIKRTYLAIALAPIFTFVIYLLVTQGLIFIITSLEITLYGWPLWFACFIFSFAILGSSNLIALLAHWVEESPKAYLIVVVLGGLLSITFFVYLNYYQLFERHLVMLYFNYPDFIQ